MRNRGYMKAPASIYTTQNGGVSLRAMNQCLRITAGLFMVILNIILCDSMSCYDNVGWLSIDILTVDLAGGDMVDVAGYGELLNSSQTFTAWVPSNDALAGVDLNDVEEVKRVEF